MGTLFLTRELSLASPSYNSHELKHDSTLDNLVEPFDMGDKILAVARPSGGGTIDIQDDVALNHMKQCFSQCLKDRLVSETLSDKVMEQMPKFGAQCAAEWLELELSSADFVNVGFTILTSQRIVNALADLKQNISTHPPANNNATLAMDREDTSISSLNLHLNLSILEGDNNSTGCASSWDSYASWKVFYNRLKAQSKCKLKVATGGPLKKRTRDCEDWAPSTITVTCNTAVDCTFKLGFKLQGNCTSHKVSLRPDSDTFTSCLGHNHAFTAITTLENGTQYVKNVCFITDQEKEFIRLHAETPLPLNIRVMKSQMEVAFPSRKYCRIYVVLKLDKLFD